MIEATVLLKRKPGMSRETSNTRRPDERAKPPENAS